MTIAKYAPGTVDAKFVAGMSLPPLPTGIFSVGFTIENLADKLLASHNLGEKDFTVICHVPSLTTHHGAGAAG